MQRIQLTGDPVDEILERISTLAGEFYNNKATRVFLRDLQDGIDVIAEEFKQENWW